MYVFVRRQYARAVELSRWYWLSPCSCATLIFVSLPVAGVSLGTSRAVVDGRCTLEPEGCAFRGSSSAEA